MPGAQSVTTLVSGSVKDFAQNTSIAGVGNAVKAKSWIRVIYWLSIFVVCLYYTVDGIVNVVKDYYTYPFVTNTEMTHFTSLEFPAVTVCNQNRVNCVNVMVESIKLTNKIKKGEGEADDNNTLSILQEIYEKTGCGEQVCNSIVGMLMDKRKPMEDHSLCNDDERLLQLNPLRCSLSKDDVKKTCYYLHDIKREAEEAEVHNFSDEALETVETMYNEQYECDFMKDVCPYTADHRIPEYREDCDDLWSAEDESGESGESTSTSTTSTTTTTTVTTTTTTSTTSTTTATTTVNNEFSSESDFLATFLKLDRPMREAIGHRMEDQFPEIGQSLGFIFSCTYRGENCTSSKYWHLEADSIYGNCLTFNDNITRNEAEVGKSRVASLTGAQNGLVVSFTLDQDNYMLKKLSKKAGARLVIHDPNLPPLPDEYGIDLAPNTASSVALQKHLITRLPDPYQSHCINGWAETEYNNTVSDMTPYSLTICQRYCLQRAIIETCRCFHPYLVQRGMYDGLKGESCDISPNSENSICIGDIEEKFDTGERKCPCSTTCREVDYHSRVTVSTWPSEQFAAALLSEFIGVETTKISHNELLGGLEMIQENLLQATIYYQSLNVMSINQKEKYTLDSFLANLGGAFSLWMGMALIMFFEIIEFAFDLAIKIIRRNPKRTTTTDKMPK